MGTCPPGLVGGGMPPAKILPRALLPVRPARTVPHLGTRCAGHGGGAAPDLAIPLARSTLVPEVKLISPQAAVASPIAESLAAKPGQALGRPPTTLVSGVKLIPPQAAAASPIAVPSAARRDCNQSLATPSRTPHKRSPVRGAPPPVKPGQPASHGSHPEAPLTGAPPPPLLPPPPPTGLPLQSTGGSSGMDLRHSPVG